MLAHEDEISFWLALGQEAEFLQLCQKKILQVKKCL